MGSKSVAAVFRHLDPPLWVVTAQADGHRGGLIATFVVRASIVPELPRALVGIARHHHTWGLIESAGAFALHLLDESQAELAWRFGLASGRDVDKLEGLPVRPGASGAPILDGALAWLDCRVEDRLPTGDRTVYLAEIVDGALASDRPALTLGGLLRGASEARRREMERQFVADGEVDAGAIRAWRAARG